MNGTECLPGRDILSVKAMTHTLYHYKGGPRYDHHFLLAGDTKKNHIHS
jgi:hypothetical protein